MKKNSKQYHIAVSPGEVADKILLCGDPSRVDLAEKLLDKVTHRQQNREFVTITGTYKEQATSVMSTGIGPDNMEITLVELSQVVKNPVLIRVGSCGALSKNIGLGEVVITTGAVRLENTTNYFAPKEYPAVADYQVLQALINSCKKLNLTHHVGITASAPGFYGAQFRRVDPFIPRFNTIKKLARLNVLNFEMEISTLFVLSSIAGWRAGALCTVFANRELDTFISTPQKKTSEQQVLRAALDAVVELSKC